jgi:hypothetical protein
LRQWSGLTLEGIDDRIDKLALPDSFAKHAEE